MATVVNRCIACHRITEVPARGLPQCERCRAESRPQRVPAQVEEILREIRQAIITKSVTGGRVLAIVLPFSDSPRPPRRKEIPDRLAEYQDYLGDEHGLEEFEGLPSKWKRDRDPPEPREWRGYTEASFRPRDRVILEGNGPGQDKLDVKDVTWSERISIIRARYWLVWEQCPTLKAWLVARDVDPTNPATPARKWLALLARDGLPAAPRIDQVISAFAREPLLTMDYVCWAESWLRYEGEAEARRADEAKIVELRDKRLSFRNIETRTSVSKSAAHRRLRKIGQAT